jgi:3'-phosphoadenosine 5'-phosphosulfate (PAPS) 3'-phosphatase
MVKYWTCAAGDVAGFVQYQTQLKAWDHACGVICVQESGGSASDGLGKPVRFTDREFTVAGGIVCTAKELDARGRAVLQQCVCQELVC